MTVPLSTMVATSSAVSSVTRRPADEARLGAERAGERARLRRRRRAPARRGCRARWRTSTCSSRARAARRRFERAAAGLDHERLALEQAHVGHGVPQPRDLGRRTRCRRRLPCALPCSGRQAGGAAPPSAPTGGCAPARTTALRGPSSTSSAHHDVAPHRQAVQEAAARRGGANQDSSHAPVGAAPARSSASAVGVAVVRGRGPRLGVDHVRAGERLVARRRSRRPSRRERSRGAARLVHHRLGQRVSRRAASTVTSMPRSRRHVHHRGGHGERQRLGVAGPGEHELAALAGTPRSSSVFQSASAWQGWSIADSRLIERHRAERGHARRRSRRPGRPRGRCRPRRSGCRARRRSRRAPGSPRARARPRRRPSPRRSGSRAASSPARARSRSDEPPSRAIAAWNEARVRSDGLKNSSPRTLPGERRRLGMLLQARRERQEVGDLPAARSARRGSSRSRWLTAASPRARRRARRRAAS